MRCWGGEGLTGDPPVIFENDIPDVDRICQQDFENLF